MTIREEIEELVKYIKYDGAQSLDFKPIGTNEKYADVILKIIVKSVEKKKSDEPMYKTPQTGITSINEMGGYRAYNQALDDVLDSLK